MRLTGLMICRNEDWILGMSLRACMMWLDQVVVVDHSSSDGTMKIINDVTGDYPFRVHYSRWEDKKTIKLANAFDGEIRDVQVHDPDAPWDEMTVRQHSLLLGRKFGGTHFVIVDADEVLTGNLLTTIRAQIAALEPGRCLDVPMLAMRTADRYQDDDTDWSKAWLTLAFADRPDLTWAPAADGYHHHHRTPHGAYSPAFRYLMNKHEGGVMHFQFAAQRRLLAKHVLYRMVDHLRWPGRESVEQLNKKYDNALRPPKSLRQVPTEFLAYYDTGRLKLDGWPYQEAEVRKLIDRHGVEAFAGLDLKGMDGRGPVPTPHVYEAPVVQKPSPPHATVTPTPTKANEIAQMVCSDCGGGYFAEIVERGGRFSIGPMVDAPADPSKCRKQRMLCSSCRGKGGPGDQLQNMMDRQRGGDPFGLF